MKNKMTIIQNKVKVAKELHNKFGGFNYRNVESIYEAIKPILAELDCHLILSDNIECVGDRIYIKATAQIKEASGLVIGEASAYAREALLQKGMSEPQCTGSASSYARKYALGGLLLLDDNKDADELPSPEVQKVSKQVNSNLALTNAKKAFMNAVMRLGISKEQVADFVAFYGLSGNVNPTDWQNAIKGDLLGEAVAKFNGEGV